MGNISICWCWGRRHAPFFYSLYFWDVNTPNWLWLGKGIILVFLLTEELHWLTDWEFVSSNMYLLTGINLTFFLCLLKEFGETYWILNTSYKFIMHAFFLGNTNVLWNNFLTLFATNDACSVDIRDHWFCLSVPQVIASSFSTRMDI